MCDCIRILHVVTHMDRGGLETMLMNYYRKIDRTKIQFDFLVHRQERADYDDEIESLGGRIYRLPYLNPFSRGYLQSLDVFFEEHREYRIVHSHLDCMSAIPLKAAKKHGGAVRIAHAHSSSQDINLKYPLKLYYKIRIKNYATDLLACSKEAGKWMFGTDKFRVFPNAIDANAFRYNEVVRDKIRTQYQIEEDSLVIGHVGRFNTVKNHRFLIEVFSKILKIEPRARLMLIGQGDTFQDMQEYAKHLDIYKHIIFLGIQPNVNEWMQAMDVFVFPSLYEGLGIVVIEAQAAGLPCIISDKVPMECKKTDLVWQISLKTSKKEWAEKILEARVNERKDTYQQIVEAGYDIEGNARWLEQYYLDKWNIGEKKKCQKSQQALLHG